VAWLHPGGKKIPFPYPERVISFGAFQEYGPLPAEREGIGKISFK
jgi:hypothetical protein